MSKAEKRANRIAEKIERLKKLREYADEKQEKIIDCCIRNNGNYARAASELGYREGSPVRKMLKRMELGIAKTMSPTDALNPHETPVGFSIDRISKHIDKEGSVSGWVIANRDKADQFEAMKDAWSEFCMHLPKVEAKEQPSMVLEDLLCDYTIGDAHIGLYSWSQETGDNWDTYKGVDIMRKAMRHLVNSSPAAETAYILDVGDYMHSDNGSNRTEKSGNPLDVDGRYAKVLALAVQAMCDLIDMALEKHKTVLYRAAVGNHNERGAIMMAIAMKMRYYNEPRVVVLDSPAIHHYYQFGCNLLADTHGHTTKADILPILMATDVPRMWADTTNRIFRTGHVHHLSEKEFHGCTVVTYRTLAPKDAWHAEQGYRSNREMQCTIYNKHTGRVGANFVNPSMLGY